MKKFYFIVMFALVFIPQTSFADKYAKFTLAKEGSIAPQFRCITFDGKSFSLSQAKGKVVLIYFFTPGCAACVVATPRIQKAIKKYENNKDFKVIAIGRGNISRLKKFIKSKKLLFPATNDRRNKIFKKYATKYVPRCFVVGRDGKIKFTSVGCPSVLFKKMSKVIQTDLDNSEKINRMPKLIVITGN